MGRYTSPGGGGGTVTATGTGFVHMTAAVQDAASKLVENADVSATAAVVLSKLANVSATDKVLGRSTAGAGAIEEIACTAAGRAIIDDANATAQRTTLGLGTMALEAAASYLPLSAGIGNQLIGDLYFNLNPVAIIKNSVSGSVVAIGGNNSTQFVVGGTAGNTGVVMVSTTYVLFPVQAPTASAPAYVLGGLYFNTTLNKLMVGGAAVWEVVTSS